MRIPLLLALLTAAPARADVVWPAALEVDARALIVLSIVAGFAVEFLMLRKILSPSNRRSGAAVLGANALSSLVGLPLAPKLGVILKLGASKAPCPAEMIDLQTWIAVFLAAVAANVLIEGLLYAKALKLEMGPKELGRLVLANGISVGATMAALGHAVVRNFETARAFHDFPGCR